jgi:ParB/RepB/Spo0J family partition protein
MPPKNDERLRAIRESASALRRPNHPNEPATSPEGEDPVAITRHFGIAALDAVTAGRTVQRLSIAHIAPDLRPESQQPRLLPLLEELLRDDGSVAPEYVALSDALRDLGASLCERQIQPIIVYPGISEHYPSARYLILVGHRRWLAANLTHLADLDAIIVDPPSPEERIQLQYAENEERADFTDMERAWALRQMKAALSEAPWEEVERRFRLSSTRRHELTRLLAFTESQQQLIAQLRLRENQLVPLHQAVRAGTIAPEYIDMVLGQIRDRMMPRTSVEDHSSVSVDLATVNRLLARVRQVDAPAAVRSPQWLSPLRDKITRTTRDLKRLYPRFAELNPEDRLSLQRDLETLLATLEATVSDTDKNSAS